MIQIDNLEFRYRQSTFKLSIPKLHLEAGSKTGFIGPSGSGKTTLLHLIAGIVLPGHGDIQVGQTAMSRLEDSQRRDFRIAQIGLVFQEFELLEYLNVLDNILLPYRITGALTLSQKIRRRAVELAARVGITDKLSAYPRRMSQGEKQRVAICRALLPEPPLILADEPTGNLDPTNKGKVLDILFGYCQQTQATLVTVTHDHAWLNRFDEVIDFQRFHNAASGVAATEVGA